MLDWTLKTEFLLLQRLEDSDKVRMRSTVAIKSASALSTCTLATEGLHIEYYFNGYSLCIIHHEICVLIPYCYIAAYKAILVLEVGVAFYQLT